MPTLYLFFRLLWRRGVAWDLAVCTVFVSAITWFGVGLSGRLIERGSAGMVRIPPLFEAYAYSLIIGGGVGVAANFAAQDLLYCKFSWVLPGLRRALRWGLAVLACVCALLAGVLSATTDGGLGVLGAAGVAGVGFGLGNHFWDRDAGRLACHGAQILTAVVTIRTDLFAPGAAAYPVLALLVGGVVCALSIHLMTTKRAARSRGAVAVADLGASFRPVEEFLPSAGARAGRKSEGREWRKGPITSTSSWAAALRYEGGGRLRDSWLGRSALFAIPMVLGSILLTFWWGTGLGNAVRDSLKIVHLEFTETAIWRGLNVIQGVSPVAILIVLTSRQDLRAGSFYPLSRARRADMVWRAGLLQGLGLLIVLGACFAIAIPLSVWAAGVELDLKGVPATFVALAASITMLPLLQGSRVRFFDSQTASSGLRAVTLLSCACFFFAVTQYYVMRVFHSQEPFHFAVSFLFAFAAVHWLYRWWLTRWFAKADLI